MITPTFELSSIEARPTTRPVMPLSPLRRAFSDWTDL